jgi:hypothetical protein
MNPEENRTWRQVRSDRDLSDTVDADWEDGDDDVDCYCGD